MGSAQVEVVQLEVVVLATDMLRLSSSACDIIIRRIPTETDACEVSQEVSRCKQCGRVGLWPGGAEYRFGITSPKQPFVISHLMSRGSSLRFHGGEGRAEVVATRGCKQK